MELGDDGILTKEAIGMIQTKWDDTLWELEVLLFQAAKAQRDAMIAAGYHKHEPVAIDDLLFAKLREAVQEAWNEPRDGSWGLFLDTAINSVLTELHDAGWRKVPPEGGVQGVSPCRQGDGMKTAAIGVANVRLTAAPTGGHHNSGVRQHRSLGPVMEG